MIPQMNIIAWSKTVPWAEQRQVEQDLIICRAIVEIFSDPLLNEELRFRGDTALNKLYFPAPLRYSDDIDLVRTSGGPIGPILDVLRRVLEPWLGRARFDQSQVAPKLKFRVEAENDSALLQLKVEINTRETDVYDELSRVRYSVVNPWFTGDVSINVFSPEEMLATKFRALLQRNNGRDLLDLSHGLTVLQVDTTRMIKLFLRYLNREEINISRAEAEQRMFAKLNYPGFVADIRPLLSADAAGKFTNVTVQEAFVQVFNSLVSELPGKRWARTPEMAARFKLKLD